MGGGQCRCCGSFLDPQLEHAETCSTAEATRVHNACVHAVVCGMNLADPGITTEPRGLTASQSKPLKFSPLQLSPDVCVASSLLQRQLAETQRRRHMIANSRTTETKLWNCDTGLSPAPSYLDSRWATGPGRNSDASACSKHRLQSKRAAFVGEISSSQVESTKSIALSRAGGQPRHEQFSRIFQRGQSGSSQASSTEPCITGDMSLLTVDLATATMPTLRLTQHYLTMTMTLSPKRAARVSLCSHQVSNSVVPPIRVCFWLAMVFLGDFANEFVPSCPVSHFDFALENILEDHGVSWQIVDEILALEVETYRRCFPAQPALSASQR